MIALDSSEAGRDVTLHEDTTFEVGDPSVLAVIGPFVIGTRAGRTEVTARHGALQSTRTIEVVAVDRPRPARLAFVPEALSLDALETAHVRVEATAPMQSTSARRPTSS